MLDISSKIPGYVSDIIKQLKSAGFEAYVDVYATAYLVEYLKIGTFVRQRFPMKLLRYCMDSML